MEIKEKKLRIKIPIFKGNILFIQTKNFKKIKKKYNIVTDISTSEAFCFSNSTKDHTEYVIVFSDFITPGIIAHESLHLVNYLFRDRSMVMDLENDETQCYMLSWVVEECYKFLNDI